MDDAPLYVWEVLLARDGSFGAMREPSGTAWVTASSEQVAKELVKGQLGDVAISSIEQYDVAPARVIALHEPR